MSCQKRIADVVNYCNNIDAPKCYKSDVCEVQSELHTIEASEKTFLWKDLLKLLISLI